jgi:hypothetical protein
MIKVSYIKILWHACTSRNQLLWKIWNFEFWYFLQKRLFQIKTAITFAYDSKKRIIYQKLYTKKFTFDFNSPRPFAQIFSAQNFKGKYESRKIFDFVKKTKIFEIFLLFISVFNYFECFTLVWNFLCFFKKKCCFEIFWVFN